MTVSPPSINACLNATACLLLLAGWAFIRNRKVGAHKTCMVGAFVVSSLFLANYVAYHVQYGSTPFRGHGAWRIAYFSILIPHIVLAIGMLPFILVALVRALRGEFDRHVRLARRVLPVWLFVSASGVLVYWMLYRGTWP